MTSRSDHESSAGFFEIGIFHTKTETNVGTLLRSAWQLGAAGVFTIGKRYSRQHSDTYNACQQLPVRHFMTFDEYLAALPYSTPIVAIEMGGQTLRSFSHPPRASYLLGAEDHGLPPSVLERCHRHVELPAVRTPSFNVAVAGSIVMFHRLDRSAT